MTTTATGWLCQDCGWVVPWGIGHGHPPTNATSTAPTASGVVDVSAALARIEAALARIEQRLPPHMVYVVPPPAPPLDDAA